MSGSIVVGQEVIGSLVTSGSQSNSDMMRKIRGDEDVLPANEIMHYIPNEPPSAQRRQL